MTTSPQEPADQDAPLGLPPVPGALDLLGQAAGVCSNGVCQFTAPAER